MFPLHDENPIVRTPVATIALISLNVLSWVFLQGFGTDLALARSLCLYGLVPGDLLGLAENASFNLGGGLVCRLDGPSPVTLISSMFMHGGWFHIIGNMWFLWVFGDNIEDVMGPVRFVAFYLLCGLAAAGAQMISNPGSLVPMVGASGAIGGVMGAYALMFPRAHVHTLIFLGFFITTVAVPALFMLGYWFVLQLISGLPALGGSGGGVAFWAHIGGFLAGLAMIKLFRREDYLAEHLAQGERHSSRHRWF